MEAKETRRYIYGRIALILIIYEALSLAAAIFAGTDAPREMLLLLRAPAYLLPTALAFLCARRLGVRQEWGAKKPLAALPLLPIALALLASVSALTVLLLQGLGFSAAGGVTDESLLHAILLHALCPALLEELLFRAALLPLLIQASGTRKGILLNAFLFALIHHSVYQIPYAFLGGILLALAAEIGSPPTAAFLHFCINLTSLLLTHGEAAGGIPFTLIAFAVLWILGAGAAFFLYRQRKNAAYAPICRFFDRNDGRGDAFTEAIRSPLSLFALFALALTIL